MKERYYPIHIINDWEEQHFANLSITVSESNSTQFPPLPPHVRSTPTWKPLSNLPFFQKTPDKLRP